MPCCSVKAAHSFLSVAPNPRSSRIAGWSWRDMRWMSFARTPICAVISRIRDRAASEDVPFARAATPIPSTARETITPTLSLRAKREPFWAESLQALAWVSDGGSEIHIQPNPKRSRIRSMRRAWAILLLVLFGFSLIGPAASAAFESQLPECCRRLGKHHCAVMGAATGEDPLGASVRGTAGKCPYFALGSGVPAYRYILLLPATQTILISLVSCPAACLQTKTGYCVSFSSSHPKRGPPSLPS
jgi:hypothetical protein